MPDPRLGEVLEVIHASPRRFRAARAVGRTGDERWRLWWVGDARWRFERDRPDGVQVEVRAGPTWWTVAPSGEAHTNEGHPGLRLGMPGEFGLLHTRSLLACAVLEVLREARVAGRRAAVLRARPRPGGAGSRWWRLEGISEPVEVPIDLERGAALSRSWAARRSSDARRSRSWPGTRFEEEDEERLHGAPATHGLGVGADEYRLTVDAERGILLRAEARLEGAPFHLLEVDEVAFDEDLPDGTFAPPAGEVEPVGVERPVPLEELPGAVAFQVLVPERPPFGPPHASVEPASPRFGLPLRVSIRYEDFARDEVRGFGIVESGEPLPEREGVEWRDVGDARVGEDREFRPPLRLVRVERGGTYVELESYDLSADELLELARSLVPLPLAPS